MNQSEEAVGAAGLRLPVPGCRSPWSSRPTTRALRLDDGVSRLRVAIAAGAIDPETTEFVVVDDGSTDDTTGGRHPVLVVPPRAAVRLPENHGKGGAVRAGVAVASRPIIAFADADMAIDPGQTPQFLRALARPTWPSARAAASGASVDRPSLRRSLMNRAFNRLVNAADPRLPRRHAVRLQGLPGPCRQAALPLLGHRAVRLRRRDTVPGPALGLDHRRGPGAVAARQGEARSALERCAVDGRDVFRAGRGGPRPPVPTLRVKLPGAAPGAPPRLGCSRVLLPPGLPVLGRATGDSGAVSPDGRSRSRGDRDADRRPVSPVRAVERTDTDGGPIGQMVPAFGDLGR
jgi:hypothetical protein